MKRIKTFLNEEVSFFNIKDIITVLIIFIIYSLISFYRLGDYKIPNTIVRPISNDEVVFEFKNDTYINHFKFFNGETNSEFDVYSSSDGENYFLLKDNISEDAFKWNKVTINDTCKSIKFVFNKDSSIGEVAFFDNGKKMISYSTNNSYFDDERDLVPKTISYMNSSYFDEVYFARTAYEYANDLKGYEWTHPPLGKIIQAIPLIIFNYNSPFLYRFMGTLAGALMLIVIYFLGAYFFKKRGYSILSATILFLDTFHFTHTRMGTVDSHLVLFMMISFLFMLIYIRNHKNRYLLLSGIFFGLSISVKWTGFYLGIGLAIIYFFDFIHNKNDIIESIVKGSIFFVVIPLSLYCLWYYMFPNNLYYTNTVDSIISEQREMYSYHSTLTEDHPFSSKWYTWPISYKPVWYHEAEINEYKVESISGLGNLVIWIAGILAFIYCIFKFFVNKDKDCFNLLLIVFCLWIPYAFIDRCMFLYHYFPVLPFLFLMVVLLLKDLFEITKNKYIIPVFLILSLIFFIIYYPVASGIPFNREYIHNLRLFDSWYF